MRVSRTYVPGVFVTPVPNAPFTATVDILSHNKLPDGTDHIVTTKNHIARASSGRIYNERRQLVSSSFKGEPRLLSAHVYDPSSRLNIFWDPMTHIARETVQPERPGAGQVPAPAKAGVQDQSLGTQNFQGLTLTGTRKIHVIPADRSGTGQEVSIFDDYWYSADLSIYVMLQHSDPRTGDQIVSVTGIQRTEPDAIVFAVPAEYKVVDETPPVVPHP